MFGFSRGKNDCRPMGLGPRSAGRWWRKTTRDLLFPPRCAFCGADLSPTDERLLLCPRCYRSLGPEVWPGCRRCGAFLGADVPPVDGCPYCQPFDLHFDTVSPLGVYEGPLREAILRTKRVAHESLSVALGTLLAQRRGAELTRFAPDRIVPIPMHWWRRLGRGTNSPEILAHYLSQHLRIPVIRHRLIRCRHTRPQKDLLPRQRFRNVRGAFRLRWPNRLGWKDSHVLLVDDILTTGATCSEVARVLRQAGAAAVAVAVVAKAQGN